MKHRKNNQGFTLIELIVVIALIAVISTVSSSLIKSVFNQELKSFTSNLDAMLTQCKVETLSGMPNAQLEIRIVNGEYHAILSKSGSSGRVVVKDQYLGEDYLECTYDTESSVGNSLSSLTITYDRYSGAMNTNVTKIHVKNGNNTYRLVLIPQTGYHKIER